MVFIRQAAAKTCFNFSYNGIHRYLLCIRARGEFLNIAHYIQLYESGVLKQRADTVAALMRKCALCPRRCGVDRYSSSGGKCRTGEFALVSSHHLHFGEEACLVGRHGSGTIFFSNCNLHCIFCQNYDISQIGYGSKVSHEELASMMLSLQKKGCRNINLVSPSHVIHAVLQALLIAIPDGLRVPIVYNSGGYDSLETLRLLDGIIDIYMPDFKFMDSAVSRQLCGAENYPFYAAAAIREMHRQVGYLRINGGGIAARGLLIRHLVLPENIARTDLVFREIAKISKNTYVNIMDQYRPEYRARECPGLGRRITIDEYQRAIFDADSAGLTRIDRR